MANVLLIILYNLRRDQVGAYGDDWIGAPNIDGTEGRLRDQERPSERGSLFYIPCKETILH